MEDGSDLHRSKSRYSDSSNPSDCVEVAPTPTTIHVRDSKRPEYARLTAAPAAWAGYVTAP
ncbi:DUF397 domain-containing protein [Streptomyces longispororuber]|uniref:DUF397 domain-containing protein n=1 Tax=Streptomyces longispororuber TaxID=68230 RepID=UPI00210EB43A|nr:DUF397 domain-containing protein [Streptomyces longispororuber]MCQ4212493.1 DUF397 domain-containing protein [Streptomyces longispororuber]